MSEYTTIEYKGQPFFDEPVYVKPKPRSIIAHSLDAAFGRDEQKAIMVRRERVHLQWMKPDGVGGLMPE